MKNKVTTEDLIQQYLTPKEAQQLHQEIKEEVEKIKRGENLKSSADHMKANTCNLELSQTFIQI